MTGSCPQAVVKTSLYSVDTLFKGIGGRQTLENLRLLGLPRLLCLGLYLQAPQTEFPQLSGLRVLDQAKQPLILRFGGAMLATALTTTSLQSVSCNYSASKASFFQLHHNLLIREHFHSFKPTFSVSRIHPSLGLFPPYRQSNLAPAFSSSCRPERRV